MAKNSPVLASIDFVATKIIYLRGDKKQLEASLLVLGIILLPILFSRLIAWFASWGLMESLAKDSRKGVSSNQVSFFYWLVFIIVSMFFLFNWSLY